MHKSETKGSHLNDPESAKLRENKKNALLFITLRRIQQVRKLKVPDSTCSFRWFLFADFFLTELSIISVIAMKYGVFTISEFIDTERITNLYEYFRFRLTELVSIQQLSIFKNLPI